MKPSTLSVLLLVALGLGDAAKGNPVISRPSEANYYQTVYYRGGYSYYDDGPVYRFLFTRNPRYTPYFPYTPEFREFLERPFKRQERNLGAELQLKLAKSGYYRGVIDGQIGPQTRAAIRAYQAAHKLPVTGQADYPLLKSLRLM